MSTTISELTERRETRFALATGKQVRLKIGPIHEDDGEAKTSESIDGEAVDFSRSGMKFTSPRIEDRQKVTISISVPKLKINHEVVGSVRWSRPSGRGEWYHGCLFDERLPRTLLSRLASSGYLERRQDTRKPTNIEARVRNELGDGEGAIHVDLVDYSAGGLRIESAERCDLDKHMLLEFAPAEAERPTLIKVRPMWQRRENDVYVVGCSFLQSSGAGQFRQVLREAATTSHQPRGLVQSRTWFWLGTAAVVGFIAATAMSWM